MQNSIYNFSTRLIKQKYFNSIFNKNLTAMSDFIVLNDQTFGTTALNTIIQNKILSVNCILNNTLLTNTLIIRYRQEILNQLLVNDIEFTNDYNQQMVKQDTIIFNSNEQILEKEYGMKIRINSNDSQYIVWDQEEQCFVQRKENGDLQNILFDSESLQQSYILLSGQTMTGFLKLIRNINPINLKEQVTKEYIDTLSDNIITINHDNTYLNYTGRNMENTADLMYQGRSKEVQVTGPLILQNIPVLLMQQQNVQYFKQKKDSIILNHSHHNLYSLHSTSLLTPFNPIKYKYLTLGKDQVLDDELLTLEQIQDTTVSHEHDYLWSSSSDNTIDGDLTAIGSTKYKNVLEQNLKYTGALNSDQISTNNQDCVVRGYIDKIGGKLDFGKIFYGYYDYQKGNSVNEGILIGTINMLGWYNYYINNIYSDLLQSDFMVFPFIILKDQQMTNRKLQGSGLYGNVSITGASSALNNLNIGIPYTGYCGFSKMTFGHFTYPDITKKYIIQIAFNSQGVQLTGTDQEKGYQIFSSGSFQNYRILLIGGALGYAFKYYSDLSAYLESWSEV